MSYETIRYDVAEHVLTLTLDRPDRLNAMNRQMLSELMDAFERSDRDDDVRAVIVTGAGRGFCAGADLGGGGDTFDYRRDRREARDAPPDRGGILAMRIMRSLKPVIAAVNGPAAGAGATFTLPMDVRLASSEARFGFVFTRRGIVPESCSSWLLPRIVGIGRALEWITTGRMFSAAEALAAGLVLSVHQPDELARAARAIAREIADNAAPVAVAVSRRLLWDMLSADVTEAHLRESRGIFLAGQSADAREGVSSFLDKRPPAFADRVSRGVPDLQQPVTEAAPP